MGDLGDNVIQAFNVLNIHRGIDVDTVAQQLLDIQISLRVTTAGRIGVSEFIDQNDLRVAGDDGIKVHLLQELASILDAPAGNGFQILQKRLRLFAAMSFDHTDHDVIAILYPGARALEHLVGFADPRRRADEDSQLADTALLAPGSFKQRLRRGPLFRFAPLIGHQPSTLCGSPEGTRAFSLYSYVFNGRHRRAWSGLIRRSIESKG